MLTSAAARSPLALVPLSWLCAGLLVGCGGTPAPKAENHACFRALDCRAGLVCVEGRCTANLTPIVPEVSAATPSQEPNPGADAGFDYE